MLVMRNIIPVVMAGVLGIYGLIVAVIIQGSIQAPGNINFYIIILYLLCFNYLFLYYIILLLASDGATKYSSFTGYAHLSAGLCCGLSGLAAGMAIGIVGDAGVRAIGQQSKVFILL